MMRKVGIIIIWFVVAACVCILVTLPINLQTQLIASVTVVAIMSSSNSCTARGDGG